MQASSSKLKKDDDDRTTPNSPSVRSLSSNSLIKDSLIANSSSSPAALPQKSLSLSSLYAFRPKSQTNNNNNNNTLPWFNKNRNQKYPHHFNQRPTNIKMILSSRFIRFAAIAAAAIIFLIVVFSSTSSPKIPTTVQVQPSNKQPASGSVLDDADIPDVSKVVDTPKTTSPKPVTTHKEEDKEDEVSSTDSFDCKKSFDGKKPVNQYVIMIDAGSSGSRVHVYHFNNCKSSPRLVKEEFKMLEPGLSSYKEDPEAAAKSLDPLLEVALETVPRDSQSCSPIAVKATAGLRMIGEEAAQKILDAVRNRLETKYPFPVVSKDKGGVSIMPGADEGVYAWVTVNYLLGNIVSDADKETPLSERPPSAAVFDLGGGSTQIVFEPRFKVPGEKLPQGDHRYDLQFGANHYSLYQHSHLGYGLNVARESMYSAIASTYLKEDANLTSFVNPCLPPGTTLENVKVNFEGEEKVIEKMTAPKESSMLQCQKIAENLLKKEAECPVEPCSFNGIYQPSLINSFAKEGDLYVISFFYDRTFPLGMPSAFNVDDLKDLTAKVCKGADAYDSFSAIPDAIKQLKSNPQWCGDLAYMLAVLHHGYDIPSHREVKIAKKIKGNELGWCLGASLPLLDSSSSGWTCKIKQL